MYAYADKYKVFSHETLHGIAHKHGLSADQLLRINPEISGPDNIRAGLAINIPKQAPMAAYFVRPGDTLRQIVYDYNRELLWHCGKRITLDEALAYNPRVSGPDIILTGEVIHLPEI